MSEIHVISIHPFTEGNLRGFAEVKIGEITICDCRIIQQPGCRAYVTGSQKKHEGRWLPLVRMSSALREQVQAAILVETEKMGLTENKS